jgi:hypothetical protein
MTIFERKEADLAVLETDDGIKKVPLTQIPADAEVGDILIPLVGGGYEIDKERSKCRRKKLSERFRRLLRK